jgi:hypothetical protein
MAKPYDFKAMLTAPLDPDLQMEKAELAWAVFGRRMHQHMMNERFVTAVTTAVLAGIGMREPGRHTAACIRAYLLTGTITR